MKRRHQYALDALVPVLNGVLETVENVQSAYDMNGVTDQDLEAELFDLEVVSGSLKKLINTIEILTRNADAKS